MKKFLAIIMAITLVLTMSMSIVALADEPVVTSEDVVEESTTPEMPADFDENSIVQYLVFNFTDLENITIDSYITATDGTLDYYAQMYASYGQAITETEYEGKRALSMNQSTVAINDLADAGIAYLPNKGFIADKNTFVYVCGTMLSSGFSEGDKIAEVVFNFGGKTASHEIIAGQQNSFIEVSYKIHWINVLIVLMCVVVLALIVLIIVLTLKKKKAVKAEEENDEYVSEDNLFDVLASENVEEIIEEVAETEEVEEKVVET
ncbi:MAG: hypothetical protein UH854_03035, partial [Clostridia bacterium]|nr:hypothetical protein [Clostridia bacterium]